MPRATFRLSDDFPPHWQRPALFGALEEALHSLDVRVVLGRPGTQSAVMDIADELTSSECAVLADDVHRIVQNVFKSNREAD